MVPTTGYVVFIACWVAVGVGAGLYLLRREAPYGRFTSKNWGPTVSNKWGWFFMEATVLVAFAAQLLQARPWQPGGYALGGPARFMVALFFLHYIHRAFVYPFVIRTSGKRMPLVIMLSAMVFNTVNGSLLGMWFGRWAHYPASWFYSVPFVVGLAMFACGLFLNWWSDYTLIGLRKRGETGYVVPSVGLFRLVASPNLSGEILEWAGYALLTWSLPALAFLIWTCANLVPRAASNWRWYKKEFPEYPISRKRLIPFVW
ncbi:MAG TPA: hypothetical protein VL547_09185 [Dinghuibacter sp.]|jgi:hypothetical protein|uniref:hypothetical protein n=1 Tax=Dinghuibacter sp. TaxID=2024697 RepID=UPI002C35837F|nr:hypothetical protein [Dinghuibacter sp.]HTJ12187.1 hypothetical protein [Dinghuibacter sp.]